MHRRLLGGETTPAAAGSAAARVGAAVAGDELLERDDELARLDALIAAARDGEGALVLLEGPAGIGKTRLLAELTARAGPAGLRVLGARAGVLEREFGFGVVRQLLEAT